jgi:hypothetical protein
MGAAALAPAEAEVPVARGRRWRSPGVGLFAEGAGEEEAAALGMETQ